MDNLICKFCLQKLRFIRQYLFKFINFGNAMESFKRKKKKKSEVFVEIFFFEVLVMLTIGDLDFINEYFDAT